MTVQTHPEQLLRDSAWLRRLSHSLAHDADEGDEIFNTALVASWQANSGGERPEAAHARRPWLAGLVRNKAARHRRDAARRQKRESVAARPEAQPSAADVAERVELQRTVVDAVLELKEPYSTTLLLRYWDDLPPADVAKSLAVPVETVRTRTKRGLAMLRERLDGVFGERAAWLVPLAQWAGVEPQASTIATGTAPTAVWAGGLVFAATATMIALAAIPGPIDLVVEPTVDESPAPVSEVAAEGNSAPLERGSLSPVEDPGPDHAPVADSTSTSVWIQHARSIECTSTMRQIVAAQIRCRKANSIDVDRDSAGEYGYLAELMGSAGREADHDSPRAPRKRHLWVSLRPRGGIAVANGYCYQMYLPGVGGTPLREADEGGAGDPAPDPDLSEKFWCCYAWPFQVQDGEAGPVFFVDQQGVVLAAPNHGRRYVGLAGGPHPQAAYDHDSPGRLGDPKSGGAGAHGHDGQIWTPPGVRETSIDIKITNTDGRPAAKARVFVGAIPVGTPSRDVNPAVLQRNGLRRLGIDLPFRVRGACDAKGNVSISGPVVEAAVLFVTADGERLQRVPTKLWLEEKTLCVEMPAVDPLVRVNANESAAIATLKNISSAQAQCQASGAIDVNKNGAGEYGYFGELSGGVPLRGTDQRKMRPPVLSGAFANVKYESNSGGVVMRSGFIFQMFLSDAECRAVPEAPTGGAGPVEPDAPMSEVIWCCYAWPTSIGKSGKRAFFVNQAGDVLATENELHRYSGLGRGPASTAAYLATSTDPGMARPPAANARGEDGARWIVVN